MMALVLSGGVSADLLMRRGALAHRPPDVLATPKSIADRPLQLELFTCEDVATMERRGAAPRAAAARNQ